MSSATAAVAMAIFLATGSVAVRAESFDATAKRFIEEMAGEAINVITAGKITEDERTTRFRKLLNENFAIHAIGRFVLGRYWRNASDAEQAEYLKLFEDFIVVTYVNRFAEYTGETLDVIQAVQQGDEGDKDVLVRSEIKRPKGQPPIQVDWRVRSPNGRPLIVDVVVEGVSMSQTQRSEFGSVIKRGGDRISALLDALRQKTASLQSRELGAPLKKN
ncbi:MAG: ABC transporter substrate-binding protein [Rhodospirillales bacterium]|nr:ABC transporter substrate-binding protein [Rhodospirillales bacterium]MCW8862100.1 ABC transporter substrate-binding protein [Rhodospirillales bacterium]MCW8951766.1 ABC transporter substrate-binding protein [Rhodospirillales bacterium]MCW9002162.1 ABC transporter substrate-binding protein [Rhodospirillales bacterium]